MECPTSPDGYCDICACAFCGKDVDKEPTFVSGRIKEQEARIEELESGQIYSTLTFQIAKRNKRIAELEAKNEKLEAVAKYVEKGEYDNARMELAVLDGGGE